MTCGVNNLEMDWSLCSALMSSFVVDWAPFVVDWAPFVVDWLTGLKAPTNSPLKFLSSSCNCLHYDFYNAATAIVINYICTPFPKVVLKT